MPDDKGVGLKGWLAGHKSKDLHDESREEEVSLDKNRVAVLPLVNMIPDPADQYFSDGMTEELISALANISALTVISRTSIMQYKNTSKTATEIGRDLAAGTIIEGSVRRAGNRVRISVQLIDARVDKHLWAESYDRELEDVFAVQRDIARNVSEALRVKLLPRETAQLQKNATHSTQAYTEYLKGRFHWNKRTRGAVEKAIEHFRSAINRDPEFALAYSGLADCYNVAADWGYIPEKDAYAKAKEAARKALELDNNLAEAHAALGSTLEADDWNWREAEKEFKRAIELNPNYASARQWYSVVLATLRRPEEALSEARKASELDPLSPIITCNVGWRFFEMGKYDLSTEQFKKVLEMQPDFTLAIAGLAAAYAKSSRCEDALAECQRLVSLHEPERYPMTYLAYVYALCGRRADAEVILQENFKEIDGQSPSLVPVAMVYSVLGNKNKALELLQRGFVSHASSFGAFHLFDFDNMRADPRFVELLENMGLGK